MPIQHAHDRPAIAGASHDPALIDRPIARFGLHFLQMCAVMCLGAITLNLVVFGAAALLGYSTSRLPEVSALIVAVSLSLPMGIWMRRMAMGWRPTFEISIPPLAVCALAIVGYWSDVIGKSGLIEIQAHQACPVMLFRYRLYSGRSAHDTHGP
jgi:hypothetical protein